MRIIIVLLIIAAVFVYSTLSWGFVLYKFWSWFVLPVFTTLPELTFLQALGLMFVVGLFRSQRINSIKSEYKDNNQETIGGIILPWLTLLFGWLAYVIFIV